MKITAITKQKHGDRYNIYGDDSFLLGISTDALLRYRLAVGDVLSEQDLAGMANEDGFSKTMAKAYDYLSRRPHSEAELRQKLRRKEYDLNTIDAVLHQLRDRQYVDDKAFARLWIEQRGTTRGERLLTQELRRKGVAGEAIAAALSDLETAQDSLAAPRQVAERRYERLKGESWDVVYTRLSGYLARRGFSSDQIKNVLSEIKVQHFA